MKIYYIAVSSWDGRAYTFDYNEFFFSEQEMDAAYEKLRHNADFDVCKGEEGIILPEVFDTIAFQKGVEEGRRLEREDVKSTIQSRIDEILGDAQPNPILRMELQELIKKIEL